MSSVPNVAVAGSGVGRASHFVDRWIYVFMATLFIATALVGFIPDSIDLLHDVNSGQRPPIPVALHLHAVLMGLWLLLLLAQTSLAATGRKELHMKLGLASVALVPMMVVAMIGAVDQLWGMVAAMPPDALPPNVLARVKVRLSNSLLEQIRLMILFPLLVGWAVLARKRYPQTHRRLMILATALMLPAAVDRMAWVPNTLPASPVSIWLSTLVLLMPAFAYDIFRRGHLHRAYLLGIAANLPFCLASYLLWGSSWWLATSALIVGAW